MSNIITANFAKGRTVQTNAIFQYNSGMILKFKNAELPENYRVDFSNKLNGVSKSAIGGPEGVIIPDEYIKPGENVYAWIVLNYSGNSAVTEYQVTIPIDKRAKPTDINPTQNQQSLIDKLLESMLNAAEQTEENVTHYPKIVDGYWYVWDAGTEDFVNTNVQAVGQSISVSGTTMVVEKTPVQEG